MVKNWILLGDEAFEGSDFVWGKIELSKEQQKKLAKCCNGAA